MSHSVRSVGPPICASSRCSSKAAPRLRAHPREPRELAAQHGLDAAEERRRLRLGPRREVLRDEELAHREADRAILRAEDARPARLLREDAGEQRVETELLVDEV